MKIVPTGNALSMDKGAVRVKVCGITSLDDALHAVSSGADALGFVFYSKSPRCVSPEQAAHIIEQLPPFVTIVGLFVNETPELIKTVIHCCHLDVVQLHGDEKPNQCLFEGVKVIKALRIRSQQCLVGLEKYPVSALLLDAWVEGAYGGTGKLGCWDLAAQAAQKFPVILAGGLTADNVVDAIKAVNPYAVDVSSGVELSPGCKDPQRVKSFIYNVKNMLEKD